MSLEEIKSLMPHYNDWRANIGFWYGEEYVKKYCTWKRFLEHMKILAEVVGCNEEVSTDGDSD